MIKELAPYRERKPVRLAPGASALLVLDMQHYFAGSDSHAFIPSIPAIIPRIVRVARAFVAAGRPVIATRHIDAADPSSPMRRWWQGAIEAADANAELIEPLQDLVSATVSKPSYDAFFKTNLDQLLAESATDQVVVCGVHTHLCCETTARSAFMRGFDVFLAVDGTATYNGAFHRASLLNLAHGFAVPALCREIVEAMSR